MSCIWYISKYVSPPAQASSGGRGYLLMREIAALGDRVGYWALVLLLLGFLLTLGFAPPGTLERFTHWLIANALLVLIMAAGVVQYTVQLARYARERRLDHQDDAA